MSKRPCTFQRPQAAEASPSGSPSRAASSRSSRVRGKLARPRWSSRSPAVDIQASGPGFASADEPTLRGAAWIAQQWEAARSSRRAHGAILVLDEVQKVPGWSETVKRLWDEDTRAKRPLKVVLLGSAPLLIQHGLTESLAGRFEVLHLPHWSAAEMRAAFDFSVDQYVFYGGYPGAAPLVGDPPAGARTSPTPHRDHHRARRAAAHPRGQAGAAATPVRAGLPLLGPGPVLHEDARPAP